MDFVNLLLSARDNIIDQLLLLKKYKNKREVKRYIKLAMQECSPFIRYCINKYYYDLDVEKVPIPQSYYPHIYALQNKYIKKLIGDIEDAKDQIIILSKHKKEKRVEEFVETLFYHPMFERKYVRYLILHYYYGLNVPYVTPDEKTLNIKLFDLEYKKNNKISSLEKEQQKNLRRNKKIKLEDKVKILEGPFKNCEGVVKEIKDDEFMIEVILFGTSTPIDIDKYTKLERIRK